MLLKHRKTVFPQVPTLLAPFTKHTVFTNIKHSFPLENHFPGRGALKPPPASVLPGQVVKKQITGSLSQNFWLRPGLGPKNLHFNKFPFIADAASLGTTLENHCPGTSMKIYVSPASSHLFSPLRTKLPDSFHRKGHDLSFL